MTNKQGIIKSVISLKREVKKGRRQFFSTTGKFAGGVIVLTSSGAWLNAVSANDSLKSKNINEANADYAHFSEAEVKFSKASSVKVFDYLGGGYKAAVKDSIAFSKKHSALVALVAVGKRETKLEADLNIVMSTHVNEGRKYMAMVVADLPQGVIPNYSLYTNGEWKTMSFQAKVGGLGVSIAETYQEIKQLYESEVQPIH